MRNLYKNVIYLRSRRFFPTKIYLFKENEKFLIELYQENVFIIPAVVFSFPMLICWNSLNSSSSSLLNILMMNVIVLKCSVRLVVWPMSVTISKLITRLVGSSYSFAHKLWDELLTLCILFKRCAGGCLPTDMLKFMGSFSNENIKEKIKNELWNVRSNVTKSWAVTWKKIGEIFYFPRGW